ncbi:hypothetical protein TYRP_000180 [Tyrophagus putrescentiae]|nr:hypothetical protein TYRP_000180 [Tyrophagus putrescentiae]
MALSHNCIQPPIPLISLNSSFYAETLQSCYSIMTTRETTIAIPVITVDPESGSSTIKASTVVEFQVTPEIMSGSKAPAPRSVFERIVQLRSHISPLMTEHEKSIRVIETSLDDVTPDFTSGKYDLKMSRENADKLALLKNEKHNISNETSNDGVSSKKCHFKVQVFIIKIKILHD